jgi:anti-anti-sigma factor
VTAVSDDCVFRPVGDVDLAVAERLRSDWYAVIDDRHPVRVIVDLRDVTFMDSSGLSVLVGLAKRQQPRGGSVAVCNPSPQIAKLMMVTGLNKSVQILWSGCPGDVPGVKRVRHPLADRCPICPRQ